MKNTLILFLFPLITNILAQPCGSTILILNTQNEVDSFAINYPNCTEIEGTLYISGEDIDNLFGLMSIESIQEGLSFYECDNLIDLSGLDNIKEIGGMRFPPILGQENRVI